MRTETLLFIYRHPKIILGLKNPEKKFGGKWNGWGGGVEEGETPESSLIRELEEETFGKIKIDKLNKIGEILFKFETEEQDHYVHVFYTENYSGELGKSKDFLEYKEFDINNLPENMMPADKKWIPLLANKKKFKGTVNFDKEFKNPEVNFYEVEEF